MARVASDTWRQVAVARDEDAVELARQVLRDLRSDALLNALLIDYGLAAGEARVYAMLRGAPRWIWTHAQLALAVHEIGDDRDPEGVRQFVKRIRKKMAAQGEPHGIVTVYGVGYYYDPERGAT